MTISRLYLSIGILVVFVVFVVVALLGRDPVGSIQPTLQAVDISQVSLLQPGSTKAVVTDSGGTVFELASDGVQELLQLDASPFDLAWNEQGTILAVRPAQDPTRWHMIRKSDGVDLAQLPPAIGTLTWNEAGTKIVYEYNDGRTHNLSVANPDGAEWTKIADITTSVRSLAWLPVETHVILLAGDGTLQLLALSSHVLIPLAQNVISFVVSPDGKAMLYAIASETDRSYFTMDLADLSQNVAPAPTAVPALAGVYPYELCWDAVATGLYVVDSEAGIVEHIDLRTNKRQTTVPLALIGDIERPILPRFATSTSLYLSTGDGLKRILFQ